MPEETERSEDASDSFEALLRQAARAPHVSPRTVLAIGSKLAGGRLEILRRIGEGGMGVVYEAFDSERRAKVALKTLSRLDAAGIYRFKNEFRALADVAHSNLVTLHELFADDAQWLFTMDLVPGVRFDEWVRPSGALNEARLRSALGQLVSAVLAIHAAGKLHRDLKPSNVLVTGEGRVVVLDFGLAVDPELGGVGQTIADESVSGTPAYMAPEQAAGQLATSASDFYALGVMLFEALTGRLPFEGRSGEVLAAKQTQAAPSPLQQNPSAPQDLVFLCGALLARNPMDRPGEAALTAGPGNDPLHHGVASERGNASLEREPLIGRDAELAQIRLAYQGTLSGQAVIMFVSGESGIGKSALMQAFLNELRGQGHATVLAGRCYERENVPFKGFDSLVDDLSRHLRKLPPTESAAVMPREVFALARIFPVLDRIDAVAEAPVKQVTDPQELKRRAFDALGELLARMRDRGPLVLFIDDAQWLDQDSVRLARALFLYKEAAPLLLVYTHRSEGAEHNVLLQTVLQAARDSAKFTVRDVRVGPLPRAALRTLAERLLPPHTQAHSDALAIEAQGSPFFAAELARAACVRDLTKSPSLAEALSVHVGALPIGARRILSLLALAGQPLSVDVVVEATGTEDGHANLDRLRGEQLVRVSIDADGARSIECYHDKIREYLAGGLDPLHARELALGLARALSALPAANNELIARMLDLAGLPVEAAVHVAHAAEAAFAALAFERSARLFAQAVEHGRFEPERLQALRIGHAEALAHAGRAEAAEAYLSAAEHASADDAHELERKAGEQYLLHGELARGRLLMDRALRRVGHSLPQSLGGALASVIWSRGRVRVRGHSFAERAQHDAGTLRELELLRLTAHCLYRSDQLRGADFSARFLRRALDAGHAVEIARALTLEILFRSMSGAPAKHIEAAKALCSELCERTGDRLATTWLYVFRGADTLLRLSQPDEALTDLDRCLAMLAGESLHATGHDRAWVQYFRAVCLWQGGRIAEAGELAGAQLEDALARGDHTAAGGLMSIFCYGLMARERTDQAERILEEARARLLPGEVNVQHAQWIVARWVIGAYAGRILETWTQTAECRGRFFGSWQGRVMLADLQRPIAASMAAAAALAAKEPEQRRALRQQARGFIRGTKNAIPSSITLVPTHALLACLEGDRERAVTALRQSLASPGGLLSNHLFRRRLGELLGGDEGAALIAEADAFLHAGGVVDPARYTAALVPGIALVSES